MRALTVALLALAGAATAGAKSPGNARSTTAAATATARRRRAARQPAKPAARAAPNAEKALQQLQDAVNSQKPKAAELVRTAKELTKALAAQRDKGEAAAAVPALAERGLAAVANALVLAADSAGPRAQLLAERAKLLQLLGEAGQAERQAEEAVAALRQQLQQWAASAEAATPHKRGTPTTLTRAAAAAQLHSLLDSTGLLRQLGWEERSNAALAEVAALAPRVPASSAYLRAVAQLSLFTDEQLGMVLACAAAAEGRGGPDAQPCQWMQPALTAAKPLENLHRLYYAAHRALHARKRYDEAWRALVQAKRLHATKHAWRPVDFQRLANETMARFPLPAEQQAQQAQQQAQQQQQQAAPAAPPKGAVKPVLDLQAVAAASAAVAQAQSEGDSSGGPRLRPIFVVGLPRSGSTLIEQILASHPEVWGAGEVTLLRPVAKKLEAHLAAGVPDNATLAALRSRYLGSMAARMPAAQKATARWLVDKSLQNAWFVGHIAALLPEACVVHAARHPADAALSSWQQSFFPDKVPWSFALPHIANHVAAHHRLMAHWDALLPGYVLHLHYTDVVRDVEAATRRLAAHCGLAYDPAMLRFYETQRAVQTASQLQVRKPIYSSSLNKWQAYSTGLAPLLLELRGTILGYEERAGLASSRAALDELAAQQAQQAQQQAGSEAAAAGSGSPRDEL